MRKKYIYIYIYIWKTTASALAIRQFIGGRVEERERERERVSELQGISNRS